MSAEGVPSALISSCHYTQLFCHQGNLVAWFPCFVVESLCNHTLLGSELLYLTVVIVINCGRICGTISQCVQFKDAYLHNSKYHQNEKWVVFTGGVTVVITRK